MVYEFLEHTADVKFRATGETIEDAFCSAADALCNVMYESRPKKEDLKKEIVVTGSDFKTLLYNFLEEFLYLLDVDNFACSKIVSLTIDGLNLNATLSGVQLDFATSLVKAPTYNDMVVLEESKGWIIECVLDV